MSQEDDLLFQALAALPPVAADAKWESRVHTRCHSEIARRDTKRLPGKNLSNALLAAISGAAVLCVYFALMLAEVVRLAKHP